jgi:hypothetical protein
MLLNETTVRHATPAAKDQWLRDGAGLYLRVQRAGSKVWVIRRKRRGKTQIITLGQYPNIGLKEARLKAAQYQLRQDVSNATVQQLADKYMEVVNTTHDRPIFVEGYMRPAILPAIGSPQGARPAAR